MTRSDKVIFSPDFHFIQTRGFTTLLADIRAREKPWSQRKPKVFWRGSSTGNPPCAIGKRVKAAEIASPFSWCDIKISQLTIGCVEPLNGLLMAPKENETGWIEYRGILDIDGSVNAWGLFWRLASKSVVFHVESDYTNLYIKAMKPWIHYIPVHSNLSDLVEKTRIITSERVSDQVKLRAIARRAQELTKKFTFDIQVALLAEQIQTCWSVKQGKQASSVMQRMNTSATVDRTANSLMHRMQ